MTWLTLNEKESIYLGDWVELMKTFSELIKVKNAAGVPPEEFAELLAVPDEIDMGDTTQEYLDKVKEQAQKFLDQYGAKLSEYARDILDALIEQDMSGGFEEGGEEEGEES
jgi:hypothetical protein